MNNNTWILIADGAKAMVYQYNGPNNKLSLVEGGELNHVNELSQDLVTTKRGRMHDNGQGQRSALERHTDPHEHEKYVFAKEITAFLKEKENALDRLIIAAAPKFLGDLRQLLSDNIKNKISAELDKDLTNVPVRGLPEHLQGVLNINTR
jgi:protein required for attachment to host cells